MMPATQYLGVPALSPLDLNATRPVTCMLRDFSLHTSELSQGAAQLKCANRCRSYWPVVAPAAPHRTAGIPTTKGGVAVPAGQQAALRANSPLWCPACLYVCWPRFALALDRDGQAGLYIGTAQPGSKKPEEDRTRSELRKQQGAEIASQKRAR